MSRVMRIELTIQWAYNPLIQSQSLGHKREQYNFPLLSEIQTHQLREIKHRVLRKNQEVEMRRKKDGHQFQRQDGHWVGFQEAETWILG